jgi:phosphoglycolate phosphatase
LALTIYREQYSATGLYDCAVYPGVIAMLDELRARNILMYIATSKRRDFAERVVDYLGLRPYLRGVYGAEPGGGLDRKQDLLAHILNVERLSADTCVMIGDRLHDIEAAHANRMHSIGALWGYGGREELEAAGANAIAAMPGDVVQLVVT